MKTNKKMQLTEVLAITKDYCELMDDANCEIVRKSIRLFDESGKLKDYITILCCKKEEIEKAKREIEAQRGNSINKYNINNNYCHIATYEDKGQFCDEISFDALEECPIHANFNKGYKNIEYFFKRFIRFRNNLIDNHQVVRKDDCYQYFLSTKRGF